MDSADEGRLRALLEARVHDPHAHLGWHARGGKWSLRVLAPHAQSVDALTADGWQSLSRADDAPLFVLDCDCAPILPARLRLVEFGTAREIIDPYSFAPAIGANELWLFNGGTAHQAYATLGARPLTIAGIEGTRFAVWAPNAQRVSVVGDFNRWDGRTHMMTVHGASGVWEIFVPGIVPGDLYKFEIRNRASGDVFVKSDPYARSWEVRPGTACRVTAESSYRWNDAAWLEGRARWDWLHAPVSIYEVHAGSWRRHPDGRFYSYAELADSLVPYVADLGYTHIELLPVTEHPLDESWGYQCVGYFAPTSRGGEPDGLRAFVNACHVRGIGVILDWVPGHFPRDDWALARFDGTALYEHADERLGVHPDWGTYTFNFARNEVRSFLLSSAHYWLAEFHFDALRVDAVASMLYLDYSRKAGEWLPNRLGGRENLDAIDFLRELNTVVHGEFPGALTIAEESTAWPMVSRPTYAGGLGFSMKWNMGWMHDTLEYLREDPVHRRFHHDRLTFAQLYAYSENFVLPLSHDEVVHGKGSLVAKMPGDAWRKLANVRLLATCQMTGPGKKLGFMGNEIAQWKEWDAGRELDWALLDSPAHRGVQHLMRDLNRLYRALPALHDLDFEQAGFAWIDCDDADNSVLTYRRSARDGRFVVVALNFTPVPRPGYRIGVPRAGAYREVFNSDSRHYGGSDTGNAGALLAGTVPCNGMPCSLAVLLPPLAGIVLCPD